jgi:hypothetical protein
MKLTDGAVVNNKIPSPKRNLPRTQVVRGRIVSKSGKESTYRIPFFHLQQNTKQMSQRDEREITIMNKHVCT